jgi:hypothetical protein
VAASGHLRFDRRPSVAAYMVRALRGGANGALNAIPPLSASWRGCRLAAPDLDRFRQCVHWPATHGFPVLFPQVLAFPLQMTLLTHRDFPLPVWRALQVRNHLRQHRPLTPDTAFDLATVVAAARGLDKGIEVDLRTTVQHGADLCWEGITTFYYRGRHGLARETGPQRLDTPPRPATELARWRAPVRGRWQFARLTGDFNGIHGWDWYARRLGFRSAFQHPQRALGQCLARLAPPGTDAPQQLETWLKGPVYYGSAVRLHAATGVDRHSFALMVDDDERPALLGRWQFG